MSELGRFLHDDNTILAYAFDDIEEVRQLWTVTSKPTVKREEYGICLDFDGTDDKIAYKSGVVDTVKTAAMRVHVSTTTEELMDFDGGTNYLSASSGTLSVASCSDEVLYVDGVATTTITTGWHTVAFTTATGISVSNLQLATDNTGFGNIKVAELILSKRAWSAQEMTDYHRGETFNYFKSAVNLWDMSSINPPDLIGSNDGTGTGLTASANIVNCGVNGTKALDFNGTDEKVDFKNIGSIKTVAMLVNPDTSTEELCLLNTGKDIMVNSGTVTYTGVTASATYIDGESSTSMKADTWQTLVSVLSTSTTATNFEIANDGTNYGDIAVGYVLAFNEALTHMQAADLHAEMVRGLPSPRLDNPEFLKRCWLLRGNALEKMVGDDGTWNGTEDYDENCYGHSAANFQGSNDYIELPATATNHMIGDTNWTIVINFKATANGRLFDFRDANNDGVVINLDGGYNIYCSVNNIDSTYAASLNDEYHVCFARNAGGNQHIYINGELEDTDDCSSETIAVSANARLGIESFSLGGDYTGLMWNVRFYNIALTGDEVIALNRMDKI